MTPLLKAASRVGAPPTATKATSRSGMRPRSFKINRITLSSCDPPVQCVYAAGEIDCISPANCRSDDRCPADEAQRHLAGNHCRGQDGTSLDINQINVEPVLFEQARFAHHFDDAEGCDGGWIADDEFFELLSVD